VLRLYAGMPRVQRATRINTTALKRRLFRISARRTRTLRGICQARGAAWRGVSISISGTRNARQNAATAAGVGGVTILYVVT